MVWKKKEKELSQEEAIELAKKEFAEQWLGSEPLFAALPHIIPIDPGFKKGLWLLVSVDPFTPVAIPALQIAAQWLSRYTEFGLNLVSCTRSRRPDILYRDQIATLLEDAGLKGKIGWIDLGSKSSQAFSIPESALDSAVFWLLIDGKVHRQYITPIDLKEIEVELQFLIRRKDPGVPFRPVAKTEGETSAPNRSILQKSIDDPIFTRDGSWEPTAGSFKTVDGKCALEFDSKWDSFALVMEVSRRDINNVSRVVIESDDMPLFDQYSGEEIDADIEDASTLSVRKLKMYRAAKKLPADKRKIRIKFIDGGRVPVTVHQILLWNSV